MKRWRAGARAASSLVVATATVAFASSVGQADAAPKLLTDGAPAVSAASFADPPAAVRPKYRWWMPAAATDDAQLREQLRQIKAVGGGGAEVAPSLIPGRENQQVSGLADNGWFSPAWQRKVGVMAETAEEEGLILDQTLGPQAESFSMVPLEGGLNHPGVMQQLVHASANVASGATFDGPLPANLSPAPATVSSPLCVEAPAGATNIKPVRTGGFGVGDTITVGSGGSAQRVTITDVGGSSAPCTTLAVAASAGDTNLKVDDSAFRAGQQLTVGTGPEAETVTVLRGGSAAVTTSMLAGAAAGAREFYVNPSSLAPGDTITIGSGGSQVTREIAAIGLGGYLVTVTQPLTGGFGPGTPVVSTGTGVTVTPALTSSHAAKAPVRSGLLGSGISFEPALTGAQTAGSVVTDTARTKLLAVVAARCTDGCSRAPRMLDQSSVIDLTGQVRDGSLRWTAPADGSTWTVIAFHQTTDPSMTKTNYTALSPEFDVDALSTAGARLIMDAWDEKIFSPRVQALIDRITSRTGTGSLFIDSYEFSTNLKWSDDFAAEWKRRNGSPVTKLLPALAGTGASALGRPAFDFADSGSRIRETYRQTYSDVHVERFLEPLQAWAERHRLTMRVQPYNGPIDTSWAASKLGIPEGEGLAFAHEPSAYNVVAAGAHMSGQPIVSTECCAGADKSYTSTASDNLDGAYRAFAGGVNQMIWHGMPYVDAPRAAWPGYHAWSSLAEHPDHQDAWGPRMPQWSDYRAVNDELSRLQLVLRQGKPRYDVAVYWRNLGSSNQYGGLVTPPIGEDSALAKAGYSFEFLSPAFLDDPDKAVYRDGALFPDQSAYRALVIDDESAMPIGALQRLYHLAQDGLPIVIVGQLPSRSVGDAADDAAVATLAQKLASLPTVTRVDALDAVPAALAGREIHPAARPAGEGATVLTVRRHAPQADYYYLYNPGEQTVERTLTLRGAGAPYRLDATTGAITPIARYTTGQDGVTVTVRLGGRDATVVAIAPDGLAGVRPLAAHATETTGEEVVASADGGLAVRSTSGGDAVTTLQDGSTITTPLDAVSDARKLTRWDLSVQSWQPGALTTATEHVTDIAKVALAPIEVEAGGDGRLPAWQSLPGLSDVSGIGTYSTTVDWNGEAGAYLDLGAATDTVGVAVNGRPVAVDQSDRSRIDLGDALRAGQNTIEVTVASTLLNAVRVSPGNAAYAGRARQDYGLIGPVTVQPYAQAPVVKPTEPPVDPPRPPVDPPRPPVDPPRPPVDPPRPPLRDTAAPRISKLSLQPARRIGTAAVTLRFTLSEPARTQVTVQRQAVGRRSGGRCLTGRAAPRRGARCSVWRTVSVRTIDAKRGTTRVVLLRRGQRLSSGRYRVLARATDAAGNRSKQARAGLRVTR